MARLPRWAEQESSMAKSPETKKRHARRHPRGVFERPRGSGIWWVRYHDEHGREYREKVGAKGLAADVYRKRKTEIAERRFFPERIHRREVPLGTMIDEVLERTKNLRAACEYARAGKSWKAALGRRLLSQVLPGDIQRYAARRLRKVAPATVNRELSFLRRVFNLALADGKVDRNPFRQVKFFKENNERVRFLSDDEETRLQKALPPKDWQVVAIALHTGLRRSELFHLEWEHVDFTTGLLTVPRSKSGERRRVPMNDTVRDILRELPSRLKGRWVFPSKHGKTPLDPKNAMNRVFVPALKDAGIQNFHWHDLRHTFASRLVMAGVDLRTVQELMGHKTIAMTVRYSHLSPAHQLEAVQRLARRATGTTTGTSTSDEEGSEEAAAEPPNTEEENRAGDRGRTGDVQLGKLAFCH